MSCFLVDFLTLYLYLSIPMSFLLFSLLLSSLLFSSIFSLLFSLLISCTPSICPPRWLLGRRSRPCTSWQRARFPRVTTASRRLRKRSSLFRCHPAPAHSGSQFSEHVKEFDTAEKAVKALTKNGDEFKQHCLKVSCSLEHFSAVFDSVRWSTQ